jgi:hypothetical protein
MSPLRVLMTTDAVGGVWTYSAILVRGLARQGCQVKLVTLGPVPSAEQLMLLQGIPDLEVVISD